MATGPSEVKTDDWSSFELEAAVVAYLEMLRLELNGAKYVKAHFNKALRENELSSRSPGSVEIDLAPSLPNTVYRLVSADPSSAQ